MRRIYLDNNAATFIDPRVLKEVEGCLEKKLGNPSSLHYFGRESKTIILNARKLIADFLGVLEEEIVFTSSGTEGANLIIRGFAARGSCHIVTSSVEHYATYNTIKDLERSSGIRATYLEPGVFGAVSAEMVESAIERDTGLIALMAANNETGVKTDIEAVASVAEKRGIPLFIDAVAWFGKEHLPIPKGVSAMSFSGLKIHAPLGCGFCFIRTSLRLPPLITGGEQEYGLRAGTENYIGVAALAKAVEIIKEGLSESGERVGKLRDLFEKLLKERLPDILINGQGPRIVNTSSIYFPGIDGEKLLIRLDQAKVAASIGSACSSGTIAPSRILLNMGYDMKRVLSSIRFSLSRFTVKEDIEEASERIINAVLS